MSLEYKFVFPLQNGLHARPASVLCDETKRFHCAITLHNGRNGLSANTKSVLSMVSADFRVNDPVRLVIDGVDEQTALSALEIFLRDSFPGCDEPLQEMAPADMKRFVPRLVAGSGAMIYRGMPVSQGLALAPVKVAGLPGLPTGCPESATDPAAESRAFSRALDSVASELSAALASATHKVQRDILKAHLAIAQDPDFAGSTRKIISGEKRSAAAAVLKTSQDYAVKLLASESRYLHERVLDLRDVAGRLVSRLCNGPVAAGLKLETPAVVVAAMLTPSEFLALDRRLLQGLVLSDGGTTSHTVILARAFGIPCVAGVRDAHLVLQPGRRVLVDARRGLVIADPPATVQRYYEFEQRRYSELAKRRGVFSAGPGATADGQRIVIAANVASAIEAEAAFEKGAEGIGLFRTEMLFMDRASAPSEEDQVSEYRRAVAAAGGRTVTFRSIDVGGDKPLPYLDLPEEANPFLGCRGVRLYGANKALVKTQFRAILRAAAGGNVKLMVPMAGRIDEVRAVKHILKEAVTELEAEGACFNPGVALGIMLEVPSAAFAIPELAREVSFFSIGTNDLAQYFFAADRGNPVVSAGADPLQPAFIRLLKKIVDDAHGAGRYVSMCGELAGRDELAPLLAGLGLDELSMALPLIPGMKAAIGRLASDSCRRTLEEALTKTDAAEVRACARDTATAAVPGGVLHPDLVIIASAAATKGEAIKELTDCLSLAGRVGDADAVEEAIWRREDVYSTGMGFGFSVPHCKSAEVMVDSIAVMRLKKPVEWNSSDKALVGTVILLAVRDANGAETHMNLFARLARKLMHEDFRERLSTETDADALAAFIGENLGLKAFHSTCSI